MTYDKLHDKWHRTVSDEVKNKRGDYPTYAEMAEDLGLKIKKSDEYTPENMLEDMLESLKKVKMDEDDEERFWRAAGTNGKMVVIALPVIMASFTLIISGLRK